MVQQLLGLVVVICFTTTGCFSRKTVQQRYYLIELPAATDSTGIKTQPRTAASCGIVPVEVHPAFAGTRIALRTRTHELNYYAHHKWAMRPGETLTRLIEDYMQHRRIFTIASSRTWERVPRYQLQTQVKQLEVVRQDDNLAAHLNVEFQLVDNLSREVVVFYNSNRRVPLPEKDLNLFASAIGESFYQELQVLAEKIAHHLSSNDANQTSGL